MIRNMIVLVTALVIMPVEAQTQKFEQLVDTNNHLPAVEFSLRGYPDGPCFQLGRRMPAEWAIDAERADAPTESVPLASGESWKRIAWDGVTVGFYTFGAEALQEIATTSPQYETYREISVGSSEDELRRAYGDLLIGSPYRAEDSGWLAIISPDPVHGYESDLYMIEFRVSDGMLEEILLRIDSGV